MSAAIAVFVVFLSKHHSYTIVSFSSLVLSADPKKYGCWTAWVKKIWLGGI